MVRKRLKDKPKKSYSKNRRANGHADKVVAELGDGVAKGLVREVVLAPNWKPGNRTLEKLFAAYTPEHPKRVAAMVLSGSTEREMITALNTTRTVFNMWRAYYPEFAAALVITREAALADARVVSSLYEMANGYTQQQTKVVVVDGDVRKIKYEETIPKNVNAAKFWVSNRNHGDWGIDPSLANQGERGLPGQINAQYIRGLDTEQLRAVTKLLQNMTSPNTGLQRLDVKVDEAQVIESEPEKPKAKANAKKK